jgi:hypothetical protein
MPGSAYGRFMLPMPPSAAQPAIATAIATTIVFFTLSPF